MRRSLAGPFAVAVAVALCCAASAAAGTAPQRKSVGVFDNYFQPSKLTVNKGSTVTWKWPDMAIDVHDVKLKSGPRGARRFHSDPASSGFRFKRKLVVPGTYRIVCTLHEEMTMRITVRRR